MTPRKAIRAPAAARLQRRLAGLSLKTIGDLLGHRSSESTCVYLRLATDDLREVALSFPASASVPPAQENAR